MVVLGWCCWFSIVWCGSMSSLVSGSGGSNVFYLLFMSLCAAYYLPDWFVVFVGAMVL